MPVRIKKKKTIKQANKQINKQTVKQSVKVVIEQPKPKRVIRRKQPEEGNKSGSSSSVSSLYPTVQYIYLNRPEMPAAPVANSIAQMQIDAHKNAGNAYIPLKSTENVIGAENVRADKLEPQAPEAVLKQENMIIIPKGGRPSKEENEPNKTELIEILRLKKEEYQNLGGITSPFKTKGNKTQIKQNIETITEKINELKQSAPLSQSAPPSPLVLPSIASTSTSTIKKKVKPPKKK